MSYALAFVVLGAAVVAVISLIGAVFGKKNRGRRFLYVVGCFAVAVFAMVGITFIVEGEATSAGYADLGDQQAATAAGFTDPEAWKVHKAEVAAAKAKTDARNAEALKPVVAYVTSAVGGIPARFEDHGPRIGIKRLMDPMPADVLDYAKFYWVADRIEGNCKYLGQRSAIEMVDPDTGVNAWVSAVMMREEHPNAPDYLAVNAEIDGAAEEFGEPVFCPAMYALLGPNGTLMPDAIKINALLEPAIADKYEVKVADGVIWSSRDYCDRGFYLEPPKQQDAHDYICGEAKEQPF